MPTTRGGWGALATAARSPGSTFCPAMRRSTGSATAASTRSSPSQAKTPRLSRQRRSRSLRTSDSLSLSGDVITLRPTPSGRQRRLRLLGELPELVGVADGQIGEHLAVELDVRRLQPGDELVVGEPVRPCARVDADDPEPPEHPLPVLAVAVGVGERVLD